MKSLLLKGVALFLSLFMILGLTACKENGDSNPSSENVQSGSEGTSLVDRDGVEGVNGSFKDVKLKETKMNLKGRELIFAVSKADLYSATGDSDAQRSYQILKDIEKDYNCKIKVEEIKGKAEGAKEIATAKASGKVRYNIMHLYADTANQILKSTGYGADLRNVKSVGFGTNEWNDAFTLVSSYKSEVMGVNVRYDNLEQNIVYFNKALADEYNLGNFYQMVNEGKWTTENFIKICEEFRNKTAGKMYAAEAMYPQHFMLLTYSNWTSALTVDKNTSSYIFNGTSSEVLDTLSIVQDAVKNGLFNPNYTKTAITSDGIYSQSYADYTSASTNFMNGKSLFFIGSNGPDVLPRIYKNSVDDYGLLPLPMGKDAENYSTVITNARFFSLLDGNPYIEEDGAVLTAIANRINIPVSEIEANNKTLCRDSQSVKMLTQNYKFKQLLNIELSPGSIAGIYYGAAVPAVLGQEKTPKQAMESISNKITTEINNIYN